MYVCVCYTFWFGECSIDRQTDGRTDRQTDGRRDPNHPPSPALLLRTVCKSGRYHLQPCAREEAEVYAGSKGRVNVRTLTLEPEVVSQGGFPNYLAISINWGSISRVLLIGAHHFGACIRAPDFWKLALSNGQSSGLAKPLQSGSAGRAAGNRRLRHVAGRVLIWVWCV